MRQIQGSKRSLLLARYALQLETCYEVLNGKNSLGVNPFRVVTSVVFASVAQFGTVETKDSDSEDELQKAQGQVGDE